MFSFLKLAAISAVLAGAFVAATDAPVSKPADGAPVLRGSTTYSSADNGLRCDAVGGWPYFAPHCDETGDRRQVRTVGLDRRAGSNGSYQMTEMSRVIVR